MKRIIKMYWSRFHGKYFVLPKLKFVSWWDSLFPGKYCWADCVSWAYGSTRINPFKIDGSKGCEIESIEHQNELCYCGGWHKGICFAKLSKKDQDKILAERDAEFEKTKHEVPF